MTVVLGSVRAGLEWQPTPLFLPGESHGRKNLVGYSPRDLKELDTTEWLHFLCWVWILNGGEWKLKHTKIMAMKAIAWASHNFLFIHQVFIEYLSIWQFNLGLALGFFTWKLKNGFSVRQCHWKFNTNYSVCKTLKCVCFNYIQPYFFFSLENPLTETMAHKLASVIIEFPMTIPYLMLSNSN